ncbi:hypothetical protein Pcinc_017002 [Petrolisthes cinctipes]|uniref:Uncharacterized protein n=1 Tax=Petrolisthes cinctipes TaxID=88211 RepID=A0AAE1FV57_PETCI|nr:hypothetical protein Pcinc_017002 [Petrolisthes cinctipes]
MQLLVHGQQRQVLVDTGCTDTIVYALCCMQWLLQTTNITTISGDLFQCIGVGSVMMETPTDQRAQMNVLVVHEQPLSPSEIQLCGRKKQCGAATASALLVVDAPDGNKAVVKTILAQDANIESAVVPSVDDLLVNEDIVSAEQVATHFSAFGLECKPPNWAADGACLLRLHVQSPNGQLQWTRNNPVIPPPK